MSKGSPIKMAQMAQKRKSGSRAQRRRLEKMADKLRAQGYTIPRVSS